MVHGGKFTAGWPGTGHSERRVHATIYLPKLTTADGDWLKRTLPHLQRNARPDPHAVRVEDVVLRYRSGRLGIADALDATATLLQPLVTAGASLERRAEWYIMDDEDEEEDFFLDPDRPAKLKDAPEHDLLVSARMIVDAAAEDAGAAALHWVALSLAHA